MNKNNWPGNSIFFLKFISNRKCEVITLMFEAVKERRTCRQYDSTKKVSREELEKIVEAGRNAPTGVDFQSFDFYVCTNKEILDKVSNSTYDSISEDFKNKLGNPGPGLVFYGSNAVIFLVKARPLRDDCVNYDSGIVLDAMALTAHTLGLQTTTVGFVAMANGEKIQEILGLPLPISPLCLAVGHAPEDWKPSPKEIRSKINWIE